MMELERIGNCTRCSELGGVYSISGSVTARMHYMWAINWPNMVFKIELIGLIRKILKPWFFDAFKARDPLNVFLIVL